MRREEKSLNNFKLGPFIRRFPSDDSTSMAMKGLNVDLYVYSSCTCNVLVYTGRVFYLCKKSAMQLKKPAPRIRQLWERGVSQVQHRCLITHFNPLMSRCHLKTTSKSAKFETLNLFVFFFALARERVAIKLHSIESRFVVGPSNILFAGVYVSIFF